MKTAKPLTTIGRAEYIRLVDYDDKPIIAKVDTGADLSSIWATNIVEEDGILSFVLFSPSSRYYSGRIIQLRHPNYRQARISNSFGHHELRYVVKLKIYVANRIVKATFTLADRKLKTYPILLGRRLLANKFLVDVSKGKSLAEAEDIRREKLLEAKQRSTSINL
jgi:hypothetical protein